jgi:hypothetical protein
MCGCSRTRQFGVRKAKHLQEMSTIEACTGMRTFAILRMVLRRAFAGWYPAGRMYRPALPGRYLPRRRP